MACGPLHQLLRLYHVHPWKEHNTSHSLDGVHLKNMMPLHHPLLNQCDQKLVDEHKPSANMMELKTHKIAQCTRS
jgi:hypothetical protein